MAHMTLLHKIPPLISAIAFGYGVGMAAPESAIDSMQTAVARGPGTSQVATVAAAPPRAEPRWMGAPLGGQESSELGRLRQVSSQESREETLEGAAYSRLAQPARRDGVLEGADQLDDAGEEALSRLQLPDLRVSISKNTLKYVRFFARNERGRNMFQTWLKRSGAFQEMVQAELRQWRLPEDLMWVAMIESGFDPKAKSPVGAMGLWQFMPATGAVYGLRRTENMDQRRNPRLATQAAAHHLRDLYMRFGAWDLALAAYNMGYEQLLNAIDRCGTTDFNELARQEAIPSETAAYVPKIAAAAIIANNLDHFGFGDVELAKPVDGAEIAVPAGTALSTVAKAAGISTAKLRSLNPDMLGERVPTGHGDYLLIVPADTLSRAQAALPTMVDRAEDDDDVLAAVDPVDLLGGRDFGARRKSADESLLSLLPKPKKRRSMLRDVMEDGDDGGEVAEVSSSRRRSGRETMLYRVGPGDTLIGVARQFAVDVEDVAAANGLSSTDELRAGSLLRLQVRGDLIKLRGDARSEEPAKTDDDAPKSKAPKGSGHEGAAKGKRHG